MEPGFGTRDSGLANAGPMVFENPEFRPLRAEQTAGHVPSPESRVPNPE